MVLEVTFLVLRSLIQINYLNELVILIRHISLLTTSNNSLENANNSLENYSHLNSIFDTKL